MNLPPAGRQPGSGSSFSELIKNNIHLTVCFTVIFAVAIAALCFSFSKKACAIVVDGETIAVAESHNIASEVIEEFAAEKSAQLSAHVIIDSNVELVDATGDAKPLDKTQLIGKLEKHIRYSVEGAAVLVNGEVKLALKDEAEAMGLLDRINDFYSKGVNCCVEFLDDVEIVQQQVSPSDLLDMEAALFMVDKGVKEIHSYTVKDGDTLWDIAAANNISVEELQEANKGLRPETMQINQEISLTKTAPLIRVVAVYDTEAEETIAPPVEKHNDYDVYVGQNKVLEAGKPGLKKVLYQVTENNGAEVERSTIKEQIIKEPEKQVIAVGAKILVASRGSGSGRLVWPVSGQISSYYGMRSGRMHSGIDICNSRGTPIAAAAGTVVRAGWYSAYGITVDIDHGNGLMTRYGHLDSAVVKYGQEVTCGQLLGRMGTTGNASGSHLHFEVRVNGAHKNPMSYLN